MVIDPRCRALARTLLADFRLSPAERSEELDRLAHEIQIVVDLALENLEHRRISPR